MNPPFSGITPWVRRFIEHGNGIALLPYSKSQWTLDIWAAADGVAMPPRWFPFVGGPIFMPVTFCGMGEWSVEALEKLGRCRR